MKHKELVTKSQEELEQILVDAHKSLVKDYVQISAGTAAKNPGNVRKLKKTIARIKTIQNSQGAQ